MPAPRGKFIWYDVMTSETKAATAFYSNVIGWHAQEHTMPDNRTYTVFRKGPAMVAGLMAIPEASCAEGVKPCWSGYIATDDVDADVARVAAAGGTIRRLPEDIPNVGRFAVAADPGGAVFLLFKPNGTEEPKSVAPMTPGHIGWHELYAGDLEREFAFYSRLFGWKKDCAIDMGAMGTYQTFGTGGEACGWHDEGLRANAHAHVELLHRCRQCRKNDRARTGARRPGSQRTDVSPGRRMDRAGPRPARCRLRDGERAEVSEVYSP